MHLLHRATWQGFPDTPLLTLLAHAPTAAKRWSYSHSLLCPQGVILSTMRRGGCQLPATKDNVTPEHLLLPSYCCGRIMPTEGQYKLQSADRLSQAVALSHAPAGISHG